MAFTQLLLLFVLISARIYVISSYKFDKFDGVKVSLLAVWKYTIHFILTFYIIKSNKILVLVLNFLFMTFMILDGILL